MVSASNTTVGAALTAVAVSIEAVLTVVVAIEWDISTAAIVVVVTITAVRQAMDVPKLLLLGMFKQFDS
jgi:hypothetical protein